MSRKRKRANNDFLYETAAGNRVAMKFHAAGITPFPEVALRKAAQILHCKENDIIHAVRNRKLRARNVKMTIYIRIIDLFDFAVAQEINSR